jgi:hypothetical protein
MNLVVMESMKIGGFESAVLIPFCIFFLNTYIGYLRVTLGHLHM